MREPQRPRASKPLDGGGDGDNLTHGHPCPECKRAGRVTLTTFPVCERCYNMYSPHKAALPHWDDEGNPVNWEP